MNTLSLEIERQIILILDKTSNYDQMYLWITFIVQNTVINYSMNAELVPILISNFLSRVLLCKELWKSLSFKDCSSHEISTLSRVRNIKSDKFLNGHKMDGNYISMHLANDHGSKTIEYLHRCICIHS